MYNDRTSNAGKWPLVDVWLYDRHNNYLATCTYYERPEYERAMAYFREQGYTACPLELHQAERSLHARM